MSRTFKYIQYQVEGLNKYESALKAGYAKSTARNPSKIETTKCYQLAYAKLANCMRAKGIDEEYIVGRLMKALKAKHSTFYRGEEVVGQEYDHLVNLRAMQICIDLYFRSYELQKTNGANYQSPEKLNRDDLQALLADLSG